METNKNDAVIIFHEDGTTSMRIPKLKDDDNVPSYIMLACAIGVLIYSDGFVDHIMDMFEKVRIQKQTKT